MMGTAQHQYAVEMVLDEFVFPDLIEGKFLRVPPEAVLLAARRTELYRRDSSHFVDEPPSIEQGGKGVVVAG
jgi:hypothetical protein